MEILRTISLYAEDKDMPFLLIGGHAVNAYGISRQTGDVDLLVQRSKKEAWLLLFNKLRYGKQQDDENFIRFRPDTMAAWPIDLMLVDDRTFGKLLAESQSVDIGTVVIKVVSPRHLITLKIHALKTFQEHRYAKDYNDTIQLLKLKCPALRGIELKELCLKYADSGLYEKLSSDLGEK